MREYYMVASDGALYDTRLADWSNNPVRENYNTHHAAINSIADIKATLRAGPVAWPGCYPLYFVTTDGAALSFDAVRENFYQVCYSHMHGINDGWRIAACDINFEDTELYCDHTNEKIPSAYGE